MPASSRTPKLRNLKFEFPPDIPLHWNGEDILATHMVNALNLLFPAGERYFIRTVRPFLERITDPELRKQANAFIAQEVQHGREHERFFDILEAQGFGLAPFLKLYQRVAFGLIEPACSPKLRLAVTAAVEHYTAAFAEEALCYWLPRARAHPVMADLYRWHALEEIEHKSVAYDVLQAVAPGYARRLAGLLIATTTLGGFWFLGTAALLRMDRQARPRKLLHQLRHGEMLKVLSRGTMGRAFVRYLRPGFHPSQIPHEELARQALAELVRRYPQAA
jgi:predicted metal-dependent hydrolase